MTAISFAQRGSMNQLDASLRAYFAPVDRVSGVPSVFDPSAHPAFDLDAPPAPWIGLGRVQNFQRKSTSQILPLESGAKNLAQKQARASAGAILEFDFLQWGKLPMALSSGSQQMNVLESPFSAGDRPSGGPPASWAAVFPDSTATEIVLGEGNTNGFSEGDLVAVDKDYAQETGFVGSGVAAAFVRDPADVHQDPHYIRRVTFNVARVREKTETALVLAQPLLAGAPTVAMSAQKILGFVDREGGSFLQEWSALFVAESPLGGRVYYHYPRLQPAAAGDETKFSVTEAFDAWVLHARLIALPVSDYNDSEKVLCFRSFIPARNSALY